VSGFLISESNFFVGKWLVECELNRISDADNEKTVVPKVMKLLQLLASDPARSFSQDELLQNLWSGQVVSDSSLYQAIAQLRKALGDNASDPQYIERVSGKGYRLIAEVKSEQASSTRTNLLWGRTHTLVLASVSIIAMFLVIWSYPLYDESLEIEASSEQKTTNRQSSLTLEAISSISLVDLTIDEKNLPIEIRAINDILLTQLIHVSGLRVVHLKIGDAPPATEAVIKGKINRQQNEIRVFLQLEQVSTQEVIWAKVFNGKLDDVFTLQDSIVKDLLELFDKRQSGTTFDLSQLDKISFDQYMLARHLWTQRTPETLTQALSIFEIMKNEDRLFPLAAVGLCDTYHFLHLYSDWKLERALERCAPLLQKALREQPNLGEAIAAQGLLLSSQGKEVEAKAAFEKAIILSPNYAFAYLWYGNLIREMGFYPEALNMTQKAFNLAPMSPIVNRSLAYSYLNLRRLPDARYYYQRSLTLDPDYTYRPVGELDFLELNIDRARAFLRWADKHKLEMEKNLNGQLTASQIQLSLGNTEPVRQVLQQLEGKTVNPSFVLYMKASLAAAEQDTQGALKFLKQRLMMHQDNERFVMPYINALIENGSLQQALIAFKKYAPQLPNSDVEINRDNQYQLAILVQLQTDLGLINEAEHLIARLDQWFANNEVEDNFWKADWLMFRGQKERASSILMALMHSGWLPDYNAETFPVVKMRRLFIESGIGEDAFEKMLTDNRQQVTNN
jgi:DNA-binding winged helix-turn-helix (wHTH) protein/Flp pilus assembly protein TadD